MTLMTDLIMQTVFFVADNAGPIAFLCIVGAWLLATLLVTRQSQIGG